MRSVKKIFFTTLVLTLTSFLMKTIGVWFNVYLTGLVGSIGVGIFQLILSVYALSKTLACGGMNLAATRLCIDDFSTARHSMRRIFICAAALGILAGLFLFGASDAIAEKWISCREATLSLKILSLSLPFISLSASLNGYMTAARKMPRYSIIQLLEQISRIAITVWIVGKLGGTNLELTVAMIAFGITASEVISFGLAFLFYLRDIDVMEMKPEGKPGFIKRMLRIALPDAFGSYIRSVLNTVEHLLIPIGIRRSGASSDRAFSDYGIVQGMALPILLYPSSLLGVVSSLLVPEIAECRVKKNEVEVNYIINRVLSVAMIFAMMTMSVMLGFSNELSRAIYHNDEAAYFIRLIAPLIPIMYLDMTTDGMLKGLDQQLNIMKINVIDSILCVVLVWILVPKIAVTGYIVTIYAAEIINFYLSFAKLNSVSKLRFKPWKNIIIPLVCSVGATQMSRFFLSVTEKPTPNLVIAICVGMILYYILLRICGGITKDDSKWLQKLMKP